jgi:hypothetical protein
MITGLNHNADILSTHFLGFQEQVLSQQNTSLQSRIIRQYEWIVHNEGSL